MTLDEVLAALRRGHCSEAKAREAGCDLCVARYDAIAQVEAWHGALERIHGELVLTVQDDHGDTLDGADESLVHCERLAYEALYGVGDPPRHPPPTTFLAVDGAETPIEEALRRAAEDHHSIAGDRCEVGSECGRLGCPECQQ